MLYADHNATTPPLPEVVAAMTAALTQGWGNPTARQHAYGQRARDAVETARAQAATLLAALPEDVVFTSGATEALNLAILGLGERLLAVRPRLITCATEHPAVRAPLDRLAEAGAELTVLPVDAQGRLDLADLAAAIDARTGLVCLMLANNETGVLHDVAAAARLAHAHGALLVCDAVQAAGKMPLYVAALEVDALAITGHKLYGPQGAGALWLRRGLGLSPQQHGGGQERGLRSGTHNLPGIVGLGVACAAAVRDLAVRQRHLATLTTQLEEHLHALVPGLVVQGAGAPRIPGTSMLTVPGLARGWLAAVSGVAASGGSACVGGSPSTSLLAMGVGEADAGNSIRLGLGHGTTAAEVEAIAGALHRAWVGLAAAP